VAVLIDYLCHVLHSLINPLIDMADGAAAVLRSSMNSNHRKPGSHNSVIILFYIISVKQFRACFGAPGVNVK